MQIEAGTVLAHYRFVEPIGEGGMGQVWRATDTTLGRDVAVKLLPPALASDPERLLRLEREARVLASLNHPHIAAIHGFHDVDGVRFLVLELVEGPDLSQRLVQGRIPVDEAVALAMQVADALEYAHERGIIHRDLKPANIKVTPDGKVKVLDFGLAKAIVGEAEGDAASPVSTPTMMPTVTSGGTEKGIILGTAAYMSPEQARGKPLDRRTDIWAFGVVLYEMLSGQRAFEGETVTDVLAAVVTRDPDFEALPSDVPQRVRRLLTRCLEKDARRRLRDVGEARVMLEDLRADSGPAPRTTATPPASAGGLQRWSGWIAAAVLAAVAAFALLNGSSSPAADSVPLRRFEMVLDHAAFDPGSPAIPAVSPDGTALVYPLGGRMWLRNLSDLQPVEIPGSEGGRSPAWSPDGSGIVFIVGSRVLRTPREGGHPTSLGSLPQEVSIDSGALAWTEDGWILIGTGSGPLYRIPAQGGDAEEFHRMAPGETDFHEVLALPGARGVLCVVHGAGGYGIIDAIRPDGSRTRLLEIESNIGRPQYDPSGYVVFERQGTDGGIWAFPFSLDDLERTGAPFPVAPGGIDPSVSLTGDLAYMSRFVRVPGELVWLDRQGKEIGVVAGIEAPVRRPFPRLSTDERTVALCEVIDGARDVFTYDVASGIRRRLTHDDRLEDIAEFLPDGRILYYDSGSMETRALDPLRSGEPTRLGPGIMAGPAPGGRIVFARSKADVWDFDVFAATFEGFETELDTLVHEGDVQWFPAVSPDGRFLLYTGEQSGRPEVYLTTYPEADRHWQVSSEGGSQAVWTRNGTEIVYTTRDRIWAVSFSSTDGAVSVGVPEVLFERPSMDWSTQWNDGFDVTADGERILLIRPRETGEHMVPTVVFVQNWTAGIDAGR